MNLEQALASAKRIGLTVYDHKFGTSSRANLEGVLPELVTHAELTIALCAYDGKILHDGGVRTAAMQQELVDGGTSNTLNSRHLKQSDGYGHAVDIVALTPGKGVDWKNMASFKAMAIAAQRASAILSLPIRQGCDWDMDGILGEAATKEWDWPHVEDPKDIYIPAATKLMQARRAELGLVKPANDVDAEVRRQLVAIEEATAALRKLVAG